MSNTDWPWTASHLPANMHHVDLSPVGERPKPENNYSAPPSTES